MKAWLLRYWFVLGLLGVVGLAFLSPGPGAPGGALHPAVTTRFAIAVIFVVQGAMLPLEALHDGLLRWRLHVLVQVFGFVVFPAVVIAGDALFGRFMADELRLGFLFLGVLPTTISTAIVFTSLAGGNTAGALVNATLSNALGVFITPLWVGALLQVRGEPVPIGPLIRELALLVLLPLVVGQVLRPFVRRWIDAHKTAAGAFNSALVLFIVYAAFCRSVDGGVWLEHGWRPAMVVLAGSIVLFTVVMVLVLAAIRAVRLPPGDRIAALFCGSQKTLAAGVPMANLIFAAHPGLGLILLPVMVYHPLQLLIGGLLVNWLKSRSDETA